MLAFAVETTVVIYMEVTVTWIGNTHRVCMGTQATNPNSPCSHMEPLYPARQSQWK